MKNFTIAILLVFSVISCGKGGGGGGPANDNQAQLLDVNESYQPLGLLDKTFVRSGQTHTPMNLLTQNLIMTFDVDAETAKGHSVIKFNVRKKGRPYFELQSNITNIRLNGQTVSATSITDPDGQNQKYWSLNQDVEVGEVHEVEFDYTLASGRVTFSDGGVRFLTDMTDLNGKFFEYWGPTGFEEDAFTMSMELRVENGTAEQALYTNAAFTNEEQVWKLTFPNYYTKSSFYVHLTNQALPSKNLTYKGLEKDIPIEVYGLTTSLVNSAVAELPKLFAELEGDYGPYPHDKFLVYMNDRSGGMEYVAATITALGSLDHELLHSWFARSVIPADGRSGWIDEAMASWRDYDYGRASTLLQRNATNLANYSPYRKSTPSNSYVDGRGLMAELDKKLAGKGGMKTIMRAYFAKYKNKVMTNEEFWNFLESHTKTDLSAYQARYALGGSEPKELGDEKAYAETFSPMEHSKHPDPLTEEEILRLR